MDREGADMDACLQSVKRRLGVWPLQLNVAVRPAASTNEAAGATAAAKPLLHLIDLTDLCCRSYYLHPLGKRRLPLVVKTSPPPELQHLVDFPAATAQVTADAVASLAFTADRNQSAAPTKTFSWWQQPALLRQVLQRRQALLEDVLPDGRGGRLAYCRIFAGRLEAPCVLFNSSQRQVEVVQQLLLPAASAFTPTATAAAGDVAVLQGLQHTQAGDTLHAVPAGAAAVQQHQPQPASEPFVFQLHSGHARDHMEGPAASAAAHAGNRSSDAELQDPSLRFTRGEGEAFVLWGRGQLQLELVRDRLHTEFGEAANPAAAAEDFVSLAEPIMHVEVLLPAACVGAAATDLTQHREAHVISITAAHSAADAGASDEESAEFTQDAERIMQLDAIFLLCMLLWHSLL
ncbi:elongation factor tu GTP-binding domain-containing protein [Cyclospora cayetanensis]|uniref:Elongation factor tu GTP-binding domain-containing protein n=1 Tax=Cyclospora cayetanensis TaxID=88456 RepID=A0A1D3D8Q8_9EIME|nr:elongation factor tu GTP-binding domain-containing protein [Cyclospora cayetanensis]